MLLKAFRLFVSSTFKDFTQERELLQDKVFPALQAYCAARGYQFHAVDLRWGVNEEAQLDQRTAEICLGEVAAAKGYPAPNLLIMIGDRYGWVPLPFAIAQDEFEAIVAWLTERGETGVVDDLLAAYQLDENAAVDRGLVGTKVAGEQLIAAYMLRSRDGEISAFAPPDEWEKLEAWLRSALQNAADHLMQLGQIDAAGHQKYFLSLTEQEIIRGIPGYGRRDVRHVADKSRPPHAAGPQAIAWIREPPASPALAPEPRINALKVGLRRILPADCILTDRATAGPDGWLDEAYLDRFATTIESNLKAAIDRHIAHVEAQEHAPDAELQNERATHRAFAEQRRHIIGREGNVAAIDQYMRGSSTHPLVVYGRSGSGKSALLAHVTTGGASPGSVQHPLVVYRFIGASATSTDQRSMLLSLIDDLAQHGILQKPEAWEDDGNKFVAQVRDLLSAIEKPVVIVLDALDQLRQPYRPGWLPDKLPIGVKIIVSVLDDEAFAADSGICRGLRQRLPGNAFLAIEPLSAAHGHDILAALEKAARRRLQPTQREYIVGQFMKGGAFPLYLRIAFEIARGWRSTDAVGPGGRELADDTSALIAQLVAELSSVQHHEPLLVSRVLGYITASKDGLSAAELVDVLSRDAEVMQAISSEQHGARTSKLPVSVWVRLHRQLAALLAEKLIDDQPLLQFFHRQLAEVAHQRFYVGSKAALHGSLASYFDTPVDRTVGAGVTSESSRMIYSKRSLSELPHQLFHAASRSRLDELLMAPDWMQQKLLALGPRPLIDDYQYSHTAAQRLIGQTVGMTAGILSRDPRQLLSQLYSRSMNTSDSNMQNFRSEIRTQILRPAFLTRHSSLPSAGAEIARLEGHSRSVSALAVLPDGRLASASWDCTIRLWDLETGTEVGQLVGHNYRVLALVPLPGGRLASGSDDSTIRIWDLATGAEVSRLKGHGDEVTALVAFSDGRLASGSTDKTIRLWCMESGREVSCFGGLKSAVDALAVFNDHTLASVSGNSVQLWRVNSTVESVQEIKPPKAGISNIAVLPDGRIAAALYGNSISLWDVSDDVEASRLLPAEYDDIEFAKRGLSPDGEPITIDALAALPGNRLASASSEGKIRLWDLNTLTQIGSIESIYCFGFAVLSDGRLAAGCENGTVRVFNYEIATAERSRQVGNPAASGHSDKVNSLAIMPSGRVASSSKDKTIRLWDSSTGTEMATIGNYAAGPMTVLRDGRLAFQTLDRNIGLWDGNSRGETTSASYGFESIGASMALLPDGSVVVGHYGGEIELSSPNGRLTRFKAHRGDVVVLVALQGGALASGSQDWTIRLWDTSTGTQVRQLKGHQNQVEALSALPDGRIASGSRDTTIRLWDVNNGIEAGRLEGHSGWVTALSVLPVGYLASCSTDRTIRLWDTVANLEVARFEIDHAAWSLAVLPDGCLIAGDDTGRLHWLETLE